MTGILYSFCCKSQGIASREKNAIVLCNSQEKIFLSIEEAAELEELKYNSIVQKISRKSENFTTLTERQVDGGRARTMVALSSLSKKARVKYKKQHEVTTVTDGDPVTKNPAPWYTLIDINWYKENYEAAYDKALDLSQDIKAFLDYDESERTSFADEFAADLKISQRTLYRYAETYLEAESWGLQYKKQTGKNYDHFKILAMCRKPRQENKFPSLNAEHRAYIENVWWDKEFARNLGTVEMLYSQFEKNFTEKNQEYPSYQTVARYIKYLMEDKRMKNARLLAEGGIREYKRNVQLKCLRDTSTVPVLGIVQGDSHTFDFWVEYRDPNNGSISAIRPTMVAWIDTRSRVVMGCVLAKNVNAQVVKQSMIKLVYDYGVPKCILIDNGKDYTAKEMLGRERTERNRLLALDKEATGFYRSIGIVDDYRTLPYQPWSKGPIERFFRTVCNQFSKWFTSYTGTLTGSRTVCKIQKDIPKLLKQGKLVTMDQAYELFNMWLQDIYHKKPHGGLKQMGERWTRPMELFENAENRIEIPPPPKELAETLLMKPGKATIRQIGIKKFGQVYMDYALTPYIHENLDIRWDPSDMSKIYVYDKSGKKICAAKSQKMLEYQGFITEKQLTDHVKNQNRQLAEDKERLKEARQPFELRGVEGADYISGKLDLMIENSRTDVVECKVEIEKATVKEPKYNEYFEAKAQEALRKLRSLGKEDI